MQDGEVAARLRVGIEQGVFGALGASGADCRYKIGRKAFRHVSGRVGEPAVAGLAAGDLSGMFGAGIAQPVVPGAQRRTLAPARPQAAASRRFLMFLIFSDRVPPALAEATAKMRVRRNCAVQYKTG